MLDTIKGWFALPVFADEEKNLIARLLNGILWFVIVLLSAFVVIQLATGREAITGLATLANTTLILFMVVSLVVMRKGYLKTASLILVVVSWVNLVYQAWSSQGINDAAFLALIIVIMLSNLLLGWQVGLITAVLSILSGWMLAYAQVNGLISPFDPATRPYVVAINTTLLFGLTAVVLAFTTSGLRNTLKRLQNSEHSLAESNQELQVIRGTLEQQVAERTRRLEIITDLSGRLVSILDFEQLITEMVNQIKSRFGFYHVQVYLTNQENNSLVLTGATGEAGQTMLAQNHTIQMGRGLVGRAAQQQQVVLAPNLARIIAPELVTAKNVADTVLRETDPAFRSQWYHNYITRIFGSLEQSAAGSTQAASRLELGLAMYDVGEFSVPLIQGAQEAARDLGVNLEITALPHTDYPEPLLEQFERMLTANKDGLILWPRFQAHWPPYLNRAAQAGIPVVLTNLTGPDIAEWVWFGQDGYQGGFVLGVEFKQALQAAGLPTGEIVVGISGTAETEFVARYEGFKAGLGGTAFTCSELFYSDTIELEADQSLWTEFLNRHPNLIAAVGFTAQAIPTLARIKTATGASWLIAGFDLETATLEALKTGLAQVTVAQHPYLQGYLPVLALVQHLRQGKPLSDWVVKGWLPNPLLPDTKAEISVPIKLQGQVAGVLDVQVDQVDGLDESDSDILQSLANQIAISIRNARQFAQVEAALAQANELQQRYIQQSWEQQRISRKNVGRVQFSLGESTTLNDTIIAAARQQALAHQQPVVVSLNGENLPPEPFNLQPSTFNQPPATSQALVAPITLRGIPIGDLQLHEPNSTRRWSDEELALVSAVIDQVAQAAEAIRLLDDSQERASREQLIGQITNKMRRATDLEDLMAVTVSELARVLEPARTFVHLDLKESVK